MDRSVRYVNVLLACGAGVMLDDRCARSEYEFDG
jgi:hypothetical protein